MVNQALLDKVHSLSDIELAILLSLITKQHFIISTPSSTLSALVTALQSIARGTFGLTTAVIDCGSHTNLDDFASALLVSSVDESYSSRGKSSSQTPSSEPFRKGDTHASRRASGGPGLFNTNVPSAHQRSTPTAPSAQSTTQHQQPPAPAPLPPSTPSLPPKSPIANIILAKNLNLAPKAVQIQALELIRTGRIFTHTAVHAVPRSFLFVPVLTAENGGGDKCARVTAHLNDLFQMAHWHDPEDEFFGAAKAEEEPGEAGGMEEDSDADSEKSVVRRPSTVAVNATNAKGKGKQREEMKDKKEEEEDDDDDGDIPKNATFSESEITTLAELGKQVNVDIEVLRYQMNLIAFMRMHRAVTPGCISPVATKHFQSLVKHLAPLHGLDYITPSLVALAMRKVYLHRIQIVAPEKERSMQWGSSLATVKARLEGVMAEDVIEEVLGMVAPPV